MNDYLEDNEYLTAARAALADWPDQNIRFGGWAPAEVQTIPIPTGFVPMEVHGPFLKRNRERAALAPVKETWPRDGKCPDCEKVITQYRATQRCHDCLDKALAASQRKYYQKRKASRPIEITMAREIQALANRRGA